MPTIYKPDPSANWTDSSASQSSVLTGFTLLSQLWKIWIVWKQKINISEIKNIWADNVVDVK